MHYRCLLSSTLLASLIVAPGRAQEPAADSALDNISIGVLAHDYGPLSDRHENGIDANLEFQFGPPAGAFWQALGAPRPHIGATPNFSADTSVLYAGVSYAVYLRPRLFTEVGVGLALHDGPLHAEDREACERDSDCGFGSRVLPRFSLEAGLRLAPGHAVTLFFDHVSHLGYLDDENEGIDHLGLRYRVRY